MGRAWITRKARRELDEIWAFVARNSGSINVADKLIGEIVSAIHRVADMPGMGAIRDELEQGVRSYPVHRYVIFYRLVAGGIQILRIIHGARNLRAIFRSRWRK